MPLAGGLSTLLTTTIIQPPLHSDIHAPEERLIPLLNYKVSTFKPCLRFASAPMPIADSSSIFSTTNHPHSNTASTSLQHPCHWRAAYPFLSVDLSYLNSDYTLHMLKSCSFSINSKESSMLYWNLIPKLHGKNHNDEISLHFKKAISGRHHTS